jgi:hypothetical protein
MRTPPANCFRAALAALVVVLAGPPCRAAEPAAADVDFFEAEIRPLLVGRCQKCHGDGDDPKGGLRLTSRDNILAGGDSGPAAVPGKPDESPLIAAVNHDGLKMPPEGPKLTNLEIVQLTYWVRRGMPWPGSDERPLTRLHTIAEDEQIAAARQSHWSFRPIADPPLPEVRAGWWPRAPLDHFVLAGLESRGLAPSPEADKRTLIRRLSFDLVGLPPAPEEVDAFLADDSPRALQRLVDRLLASPHHGERWGRHWLDVARYADTLGYVFTREGAIPWSYTYRDYVVRALNDDLPYDRFIVEQIAADKLPLGDDRRPLAALGFLTLGNAFMDDQHDVIDDRIDVVTRGLLGLTVSCARCHDHKYDPIPTRDYYSLYGVMASSVEPTVPPLFEDPPQTEAYAAFAKELAERERKLQEFLDRKFRELVEGARSRAGEYLLACHELRDRPPTEDFMLLADTNAPNPTMIIRYQGYLARLAKGHDGVLALWHALAALPDHAFEAQAAGVVERVLSGASAEQPVNPLVAAAFADKPLTKLADAAHRYGELFSAAHKSWQAELAAAASAGSPAPAALADENQEAIRQILYGPETPADVAPNELNWLELLPDRPAQDERKKLLSAVEKWRVEGDAAPPRAMVLEDLPKPHEPRVFLRGNPSNRGQRVPRRFLRVLSDGTPPPFTDGSGRLELARAIADPQNPLTARVIVNRVWLAHFGQALVRTPSDFGFRSNPPSHPELLDHLARNFMANGWSLKWLHRQIVLSATYAQASDELPEPAKIDPENTWLWRMNRTRLDFETTRDALLAVAGRLDETVGGPPVKENFAPAATRRTLYSFVDRFNLPGIFRTFDFPSPDATSPERPQTTVPQQALFFMNHPLVIEAAKALLARPDVASQTDPAAKIARLVRLAFGRQPSGEELSWALQFVGPAADRPAVWNELAQGLLAANEFVFID